MGETASSGLFCHLTTCVMKASVTFETSAGETSALNASAISGCHGYGVQRQDLVTHPGDPDPSLVFLQKLRFEGAVTIAWGMQFQRA